MTDQQHPITPPPELVRQWGADWYRSKNEPLELEPYLVAKAVQWGADRELEACCAELESIPSPLGIPFGKMAGNALRAARRPKPPSLKERIKQAISSSDTGLAIYFSDDRIIIESSILDLTNRANLANDLRQVADALSPGAVGGFNG